MRASIGLLAALFPFVGTTGVVAEQSTNGVFVGTRADRVQLTAYAEPTNGRRLRMVKGTLDDAPRMTPSAALRIFCYMPSWQPSAVVLGTAAVFGEDNAETRTLPFASRMLNVFAMEVRTADLEDAGRVAQLLDAVKASGNNPAYVFVVMFSGGLIRYYPVRLTLES